MKQRPDMTTARSFAVLDPASWGLAGTVASSNNSCNLSGRPLLYQHQQYPISDLYQWIKSGSLELSPDFQRGDIWHPSAQSFFIDTLVRGLPIPSIYMRLVTNPDTKTKP